MIRKIILTLVLASSFSLNLSEISYAQPTWQRLRAKLVTEPLFNKYKNSVVRYSQVVEEYQREQKTFYASLSSNKPIIPISPEKQFQAREERAALIPQENKLGKSTLLPHQEEEFLEIKKKRQEIDQQFLTYLNLLYDPLRNKKENTFSFYGS